MPDVLEYRKKFGAIVPSTNTVVEADYDRMAPHAVTFHTGRVYISLAFLGEWAVSISLTIRREPPLPTRAGKMLPFQLLQRPGARRGLDPSVSRS